MGYRNDLDAAQARIASLEASVRQGEEARRALERALGDGAAGTGPWRAIAIAAIACTCVLGVWTLARRAPLTVRRAREDVAPSIVQGPPSPELAPSVPPPSVPPPEELPPSQELPPPAPSIDLPPEPAAAGGPVFFGQYWEARIGRTRDEALPTGTRCLVTIDPNRSPRSRAGVATVRCGDRLMQAASVTPPTEADQGYCWYSGRELYCAPPADDVEVCWINTASHVARCRAADIEITTIMRDPREHPRPDLR